MSPGREWDERDLSKHDVTEALGRPELQAKLSLLHEEMFEKRAPAVDRPIVNTGHGHRGRLVFGDALQ